LSGRVTPMPSIPYTWSQPAKSLKPPQCTHKLNTAVCRRSPISASLCPSRLSLYLALRFFGSALPLRSPPRNSIRYHISVLGNHVSTPQLSRDISNFYGNHNRAEFLDDSFSFKTPLQTLSLRREEWKS